MSTQDVKVVFGNIEELAAFADEMSDRLEVALGSTVPGGTGEDAVGELFYELVSVRSRLTKRTSIDEVDLVGRHRG